MQAISKPYIRAWSMENPNFIRFLEGPVVESLLCDRNYPYVEEHALRTLPRQLRNRGRIGLKSRGSPPPQCKNEANVVQVCFWLQKPPGHQGYND
eukprot:1145486-Pelagomonas_calceolata.AAC.3